MILLNGFYAFISHFQNPFWTHAKKAHQTLDSDFNDLPEDDSINCELKAWKFKIHIKDFYFDLMPKNNNLKISYKRSNFTKLTLVLSN
jgi:hypothetical protein